MKRSGFIILFCLMISSTSIVAENARPQISITDTSLEKIRNLLVSRMVNLGFRLSKSSEFDLVFDKEVSNFAVNFLFSTSAGGSPNERISFVITNDAQIFQIVADIAIISNPGTGLEHRTDVTTGADAPNVQGILDSIKESASKVRSKADRTPVAKDTPLVSPSGSPHLGFKGDISTDHDRPGLAVAFVEPESPSDKAGLQTGDLITSIGGVIITNKDQMIKAMVKLKTQSFTIMRIERSGKSYNAKVIFTEK